MSAPARGPCALLALLSAAVPLGCVDLFHSTDDFRTAFQIDATTDGCAAPADGASPQALDASPFASVDLCATTRGDPFTRAQHVCAWLGACATPMGQNAFGACMLQALLAYDCAANPNHPARGKAHDLWACLDQAAASPSPSCDAINGCIASVDAGTCASTDTPTACAGGSSPDVRLACDGGAENCALWGQTCVTDGRTAWCGSTGDGLGCLDGGNLESCQGGPNDSKLHACGGTDGHDVGIDCASNGLERCDGFPIRDAASWVACVPSTDAGATCAPIEDVVCDGGVAHMCPAGVPEIVDCAALLGARGMPDACSAGVLGASFDWTSPCWLGACGSDTCDGSALTACARGATFSVDCKSLGLGLCQIVSADSPSTPRAVCLR